MTSREIVQRALRLQKPPRLPLRFGIFGHDDCGGLPIKAPDGWTPPCEDADEWGCVWAKTEIPNMGQVKGHPLEDLSRLDAHPMPDYNDDSRYEEVPGALAQLEAEGKYIMVGIFMVLFERMHTLHGFENTLCDLLTDRPAAAALADRILDVHLTLVESIGRRFPGRVHGFGMTDDWGTQQAAFISLDLWRDFFLPRYQRLFAAMHAIGCDVWVHSCGKVNEIIEGYIEAGVNAVNLQQPRALGIEEIGRRYRGRIVLESLADIQHTLPTGDRDKIRADARDLMSHWALPSGGFVFSDYGDGAAIGVHDLETKVFMYRCFSEESKRLYGEPLPEPKLPV